MKEFPRASDNISSNMEEVKKKVQRLDLYERALVFSFGFIDSRRVR
jgi:hypothetical protein